MDFNTWNFLLGLVLLLVALGSGFVPRLPLSTGLLYLGLSLLVGPMGFGLLAFHPIADANWIERLSEWALIVSLFVGGLRLRLPLFATQWRIAYRLAGPAMLYSVAGTALLAHGLGLDLASALLLGAILAPTDPVLASEVAVSDAEDHDRLRYGLSGEAGLNDGTAFPFLILGLLLIEHQGWGGWVWGWALERLVWAVPAGLLLGYGLGMGVGRLAIFLRRRGESSASSDLLLLALIALSYSLAHFIQAWGFLAVFAAAVGLRQTEAATLSRNNQPLPEAISPSIAAAEVTLAEALVERPIDAKALRHPAVAAGLVLTDISRFGETLDRLLSLLMVTLVGVLMIPLWDWRGIVLGFGLLFVVRPLAAWLALLGSLATRPQRALMGWFGIRGIGSLYYLAYAIGEGIGRERAEALSGMALSAVALSIVLHGISVTPLLKRYEQQLDASGEDTAQP